MLRFIPVASVLALSLSLVSCKDSDDKTSTVAATDATGLVFTGNNGQTYPWSSSLYRLNTETFEIEKISEGESSDAVVFNTGSEVILFNRAFDSQNYRLVTPNGQSLTLGTQTAFTAGASGDPHDLIDLGAGEVLLSNYTAGKITIMNKTTGAKVSDVEADWDLPAGVSLQPEALWRTTVNGKTLVYVLHQAGQFEGNLFTVNNSQSVFVLELNGQTLTPVDLDPNTAKVQGIKIRGSFPIALKPEVEGSKLLIVSMCSAFVAANPTSGAACQNSVEELDPATQTVTELWNLDGSGYFMNGSTLLSAGGNNKFLAQIQQTVGTESVRRVVKFDPIAKTAETVYDYAPESGGYYGLYYDESRGNLFIGDINVDTLGKFTIIKADGTQIVKTLDGIPYSGTFVY